MLMSTLLFVAASGAGSLESVVADPAASSLKDRMLTFFCQYSFGNYCGGPRAAPTELAETPELTAPATPALQAVADPAASSVKDRMLTLFCQYSFGNYCGGPRAAPTELKPVAPVPEKLASPAFFCSYSFGSYCGLGPRAAPTELKLSCPGVTKDWAEHTAHIIHSATLADLRTYYNPATPVADNGVPTLTRDLQTVLANTPEVDFGSTFTDPLANKLAYHVGKQFSEDNAGLPATWRPQDILVHVMHMNELSLEVGKKYQTTKPSEETCSCLEAREGEIRAELEHIADYFRKVPEIQRLRGEFKAEDFKATNWNINAATFQQTKENSDGMDVETVSADAATYLKCKLGKF